MTSSSNSTMDDTLSESNQSEYNKKNKSRSAHYTDDERLKLIEEVYKRRMLWDVNHQITTSPAIRRQAFSDIANIISTEISNKVLKSDDIEKQWKNLKDSFVKIRKKHPIGENASPSSIPRWRFFRLLQFIDSDERITKSFDFAKELADIRKEQRKSNKSNQPSTSSKTTSNSNSNSNSITQLNHTSAILSNCLAIPSHHQVHVNLLSTSPQLSNPQVNATSRKRPSDQFTYVRHVQPPSFHIDKSLIQSSSKDSRLSNTSINGIMTNGLGLAPEDEYVTFCKSLVSPIREIGSYSRMEYVKLQKVIHDALYEIQTKIHSNDK